jgi:hypothetical protein
MEEDRPTDAAATQYPAANQEAQDPAMIFAFAFVFVFVVIVVIVVVFVFVTLLTALAQEVRKKQAADAAAAQQAACNQELEDTMLLIASRLAFFTWFVAFFAATTFTQQVCEKHASHTPTAQAAANYQFVEVHITHDAVSLLLRLKPLEWRGPISAPSGTHSRIPRS